jgi:Putative peptidoglycan binding domain
MRRKLLLLGLLAFGAMQLFADEATRRAQEELRKRNLYFGDVNGQTNPELIEALKRYQTRKGFNPTGQLDEETASSLKIEIASSNQNAPQPLPDIPVLKSDVAREMAEPDRAKLEAENQEGAASEKSPAPPAEFLTKTEQAQQDRVTKFVQNYLRDAETDDVDLQVSYYAFPVQYFDHGSASREFVTKDTANYCKRWPQRHYKLLGPVRLNPTEGKDEIQVEFTISFNVSSGSRVANGKTRNLWTIRPEQENFKIVVINEQRLHD